jgi:tetratricopeptide (TPR) repeat protein
MSREALVYAVSGTFFGLLMGWILGSQSGRSRPPLAVPQAAAAPAPASQPAQPPPLDTAQAAALESRAGAEPANVDVRVELANLYFHADRYEQSIPWYQAALKLRPRDVNVSTDLATALYAVGRIDEALTQVDHALSVDPKSLKTLLNRGLFLAFGKQDLEGAAQSWERVVALAPDSEEAQRARQGLDGIRAAHGGGPAGAAGAAGSSPGGSR